MVWSDRPGPPAALRAIGLPPRSPGHLLGWAAAGTLVAGLLLGGLAAQGALGAALVALAGLPAVGVGGLTAWGLRRRRQTAYALTSQGRGLVRRRGGWLAFRPGALAAPAGPGEWGTLDWGSVEVEASDGVRRERIVFEDVAYPLAVVDLVVDGLA